MCIVSALHDYGRRQRDDWWTRPRFDEWKRVVDAAKTFDKNTGQPDCEDAEKLKFIEKIEARLKTIEKMLAAESKIPPDAAPATPITPAAPRDPDDAADGRVYLMLLGSSILPATFTFCGKTFSLGDVVREAFAESKLSIDAWNSLPAPPRDRHLVDTANRIKARCEKEAEVEKSVFAKAEKSL